MASYAQTEIVDVEMQAIRQACIDRHADPFVMPECHENRLTKKERRDVVLCAVRAVDAAPISEQTENLVFDAMVHYFRPQKVQVLVGLSGVLSSVGDSATDANRVFGVFLCHGRGTLQALIEEAKKQSGVDGVEACRVDSVEIVGVTSGGDNSVISAVCVG